MIVMSQQEFFNKLIGGNGRVVAKLTSSNVFPFVGEDVLLKAITKWAQEVKFRKISGVEEAEVVDTIENTTQENESNLTISSQGELEQIVAARNFAPDGSTELFSTTKNIVLHAMSAQVFPYHDVEVSSEISRTNQGFTISIKSDNGYDLSRAHSLSVYILQENGSIETPVDIITQLTNEDFTLVEGVLVSNEVIISTRGIYDIETSIHDTLEDKTIQKRINKLITITPRLAARPDVGQIPFGSIYGDAETEIKMYKTGENDLYATFTPPNKTYYHGISLAEIPAGYDAYTLVLSKPYAEDDNVYTRLRFDANGNNGVPNASGTPQFTWANPLVITIDSESPIEFHGSTYHCLNYTGDIHNTVIDGRGYYNLHNGIKFTKNPVTLELPVTAIQILNGTQYFEIFEVEFTDVSFTPTMSKTDPHAGDAMYWWNNYEMRNFWFHHNYTHDTDAEGCYIGYFTPEESEVTYTGPTITFKNLSGVDVTYINGQKYMMKAHRVPGLRFYRNIFERTGYDGVQISNSEGEVCYNKVIDCAYKEEASQTSGLSIQGFTGKCYNNIVLGCRGPNIQMGPLGDIEFFNNVVYSTYGNGIQFLFSHTIPELYDPDAITVLIHNNVIITPGKTANGRNTVQVKNVHLYDNILGNDGALFSNMAPATLAIWDSFALNNISFDYTLLDSNSLYYKIADYANGDFRLAYNSPAIDGGVGSSFNFDFRGYRNWYYSLFPRGAYMGKYMDTTIADSSIILNSVSLSFIGEAKVAVTLGYYGTPTYYKVGETADLSTEEWIPWSENIEYTFSTSGENTLYVQIKNAIHESAVVSQFIKFSGEMIEFTITLPESVDPASVDVYFPALKYNKKIAVSWINDDLPAIYNFVIALINKKYMTGSATYHMGMPKSGGSVPSKPLEYTDGAGVRHRFATTLAVFSYLMAYMGYDGEDSSWSWVTNPELRYGIDFGLSLGFHDLKKSVSEPAAPSDQATFDALLAHNLAVIEELTHFRPKLMAEPNGNHSYVTWGQGNDQIQFQTAQASVVSQVFPFRPNMTLDKYAVTAMRYFYSPSVLTQVVNKVATQIAGPEADREWLIVGNHACEANIEKYFFELMESLYGASGSDEIWFPSMDEMFEYWWFKTYSNLSKVVNGNQISVRLHIPTSKDFYYKSLSVMVSGTGVTDAGDIAVSSSENCPGTSFAINNNEIMVNVNFGELLLERAEKYVSKFEASLEVTDKDDAQYFVQQLKPGVREAFQARIDALSSAPVLTAVVINSGASSTLNRVVSVALTTTRGLPAQYMISESSDFADASWVAYSTPITFSLEDVGGAHTVYVKVKNNFGESGTQSDSITYNRIDLELLTMIINNGDSDTQSRSATIAITHRGTYAATHYMASESASFVGASWMPIASSFPFDLSSGNGVKTVYVKLKNDVEESNTLNDSITYSAIPFALTSVVINSGAASTTSRSVSIALGLSGDNLPTQFIVSENSNFSGASWQTYTSSVIPFELSNTGGMKTVYVQVKNATETSLVVSDTITFDRVALQLTLVNINTGAPTTMNRTVSVALSYVGADAPTHYMISEASDLAGATWVAFTASPLSFQLSQAFGSHTVYVKLKNSVEETNILSDSVTLLEAVSLASISINSGAASTSSQSVNVEFFYGGTPTHYMLSESPTFAGASWIAFTTPATFSLSDDDATKTVYAKLKDADTETPAVSSMISYEEAPQIGRKVAFSPRWNTFSTETLPDGTVVNLCGVVNYDGYVNRVLKDTAGVDWFTRVVRESELPATMVGGNVFQDNSYRAPTLSGDTGPYPDKYFSKYMAVQTQNLVYPAGAGLLFSGVTPGTYKVRVLLSCKQNDTINNQTSIKYVANDVVASPTGNIPLNNTSIFVDINDVVVGGDGLLSFFVTHTVAVASSGFNFLEIIRTA